jgi:hypothetical protein
LTPSSEEAMRRVPALDYFKEVSRANQGQGYGWCRLEFNPIIITKPNTIVNYGVSTDPEFTGGSWLGQWFSACDFLIERIEDLPEKKRR